jgi:hypothetical protein
MIKKPSVKIRLGKEVWQPKYWLDNINGNSFAMPSFKGSCSGLEKEINRTKILLMSTGDQIADLLYCAYCSDSSIPEMLNIQSDMEYGQGICVGNINLWTPKGVYVVQVSEEIRISSHLKVNDLEKKLKGGKELSIGGIRISGDRKVRFAPQGSYSFGGHTPEEFAKDGFVVASCGPEGAQKLGEVSSAMDCPFYPSTWGLELKIGQKPIQTTSEVEQVSFWHNRAYLMPQYLHLSGACDEEFMQYRTFGVYKTQKAKKY